MSLTSQLVTVLVFKLAVTKKAVADTERHLPSPGRTQGEQVGLGERGGSGRQNGWHLPGTLRRGSEGRPQGYKVGGALTK